MSDSTGNKNSPVRLPEELRKELRREAFQRGEQTGKEPTFGDLLLEAWRAFKSIPNSDNPEITQKGSVESVDPAQKPKVNSRGEVQISVPEADAPWVQKLLKVRNSDKPGLPTALENNMLEFEWADAAYDELRKQKSPLVSIEAPGTGRRGAAPREFPAASGAGGDPGITPGRTSATRSRLDALEEADRESEKRKKDPPGQTG